jgi:hypothetical protein
LTWVRRLGCYRKLGDKTEVMAEKKCLTLSWRQAGQNDVARLHQIQGLRKFGMALADIGAYLDSPDPRYRLSIARSPCWIVRLTKRRGCAARQGANAVGSVTGCAKGAGIGGRSGSSCFRICGWQRPRNRRSFSDSGRVH